MISANNNEKSTVDASIVINVYNQLYSLLLTIKALNEQDYTGTMEIIVCDDGSAQNLIDHVRQSMENSSIIIKYIWQQDKGMRETVSFNNGIYLARGKYVIFLAGDMVPALDFVRKHVEAHTKEKLIVAGNRNWRGYINKQIFEKLNSLPSKLFVETLESNWETDDSSKKREKGEVQIRSKWLSTQDTWRAAFACNLSIEKTPDLFFDEKYLGWGNYDQELALRLAKKGYETVYLDNIHAYHLETQQVVANMFRTKKQTHIINYMKNTCYFFDKYKNLDVRETYMGFAKFVLDEKTNEWNVIPSPESYTDKELELKVKQIRTWLKKENYYPETINALN